MGRTLRISRALRDRIAAEAASSADEVCGLLLGVPGEVTAILPCRNVHPTPARRFEIDPAALIAAHRAARAGGAALLGCYHSHPSGDPRPSPRDAADAAADGWIWIVCSGHDVTAWRAVADGALHGRFDRVDLALD